MLIRFRARTTPAPLTDQPAFSGLFAVDTESPNVRIYIAEKTGSDPTIMDCFCGKTLYARNDPDGATQNQGQDITNGRDLRAFWGCTDPADAPMVGSTIEAGALVFNGALNCRARITKDFDVPAVDADVQIEVASTTLKVIKDVDSTPTDFPLLAVDAEISIAEGMYRVISIDSATTATVRNLGEPCAFLTPFG